MAAESRRDAVLFLRLSAVTPSQRRFASGDQHKNKIRLNAHDSRQKSPTAVKSVTSLSFIVTA